jgi:hypothetical protein
MATQIDTAPHATRTNGSSVPAPAATEDAAVGLARASARRAAAHQLSADRWRNVALALVAVVVVLSAACGAAMLDPSARDGILATIFGGLGIAAALVAALTVALAPQGRAEAHRQAAAGFRALHAALDRLSALTAPDSDRRRHDLTALLERRERLEMASPAPEQWTRRPRGARRRAQMVDEAG